jgi:hypothetical protein
VHHLINVGTPAEKKLGFLGVSGTPGLGGLAAASQARDVAEYGLLVAVDEVATDDEPLEHGLIHQPPEHWAGCQVGLVAAPDDRQSIIEGLYDVLGFVSGRVNPVVGLGTLGLDTGLLGLQDLL